MTLPIWAAIYKGRRRRAGKSGTLRHTYSSSRRSPKHAALASFLPSRMKGVGAQASCVLQATKGRLVPSVLTNKQVRIHVGSVIRSGSSYVWSMYIWSQFWFGNINWKFTGKLDSLQIVVPHAITVLQDAAPRTFTTLYTIKRQFVHVSSHTILVLFVDTSHQLVM